MPEAEPREGAQLLLDPAPWHRLAINIGVIQLAADGPNVSTSMASPSLLSFSRGCCYYLPLLLGGWGGYPATLGAKAASL